MTRSKKKSQPCIVGKFNSARFKVCFISVGIGEEMKFKGGGAKEEEQKIGEKLNSVGSAETREKVQRRNARKQENLYFEWEERSKGTRIASPCDQKVPKTSSGRVRRMVKIARKR